MGVVAFILTTGLKGGGVVAGIKGIRRHRFIQRVRTSGVPLSVACIPLVRCLLFAPVPPSLNIQSDENAAGNHCRHTVRKDAKYNPENVGCNTK
jgi:hypothetical protein